MKNLWRKFWYLTAVAFLCCAAMAFGQTNMTLQSTVTSNPSLDGVYTGAYPFTLKVNGTPSNITAVCDDYYDEIYINESWNVNVTQLSSLGTTFNNTVYFPKTNEPPGASLTAANQAQLYDEVAYLVQEVYNPPAGYTVSQVSYAIWNIFDPGANQTALTNSGDWGKVQALVTAAQLPANYGTVNTSEFEILSWDGNTSTLSCPSGDTCGTPQEFIVYTPESSSTILFGADMLGLLGLAIVFRRRLLRPLF